ncbi:MAG: DUF4410 domain-containing protein [Gammaproteobacteria bacterium]
MLTRFSITAVLFYSLLMSGCASNPSAGAAESIKQAANSVLTNGRSVSKIIVSLDNDLASDRKEAADQYSLADRIKTDVQAVLEEKGVMSSSENGVVLNINVSSFRLRSGASAFWAGAMAGADNIFVTVDAESNGAKLKTFKTDISTALGGLIAPSPSQRINRMSKALAKRIVSKL